METESSYVIEYTRSELSDKAKSLLEEVKNYVSDPDKIVDAPFSGLHDQYMMGVINENQLTSIVEKYKRVKDMYDKGIFTP